ncbi:MAG TPA: hypothetical protein VJ553_04865 [Candidatus Paceibacterota bacterium]|nr:hypothetical protein [Candidatus Paceibacterota bacterium]
MQLKKDGPIALVAYGHAFSREQPEKTSVCRLFWRFWLSLAFAWPLTILALAVVSIGSLLIGYRLAFAEGDEQGKPFVPIKHWPRVRGHQVWPLWLPVAWLGWVLAPIIWSLLASLPFLIFWGTVGALLAVAGSVWLILTGVRGAWHTIRDSELVKLLRLRAHALKDKVCPIVEFK